MSQSITASGKKNIAPAKVEGWKGYTIDELRYRRAYVLARLELEKQQLLVDIEDQRSMMTPLALLGHLGSMMQYAQWGLLAFQTFKAFGSLFRRKKR